MGRLKARLEVVVVPRKGESEREKGRKIGDFHGVGGGAGEVPRGEFLAIAGIWEDERDFGG